MTDFDWVKYIRPSVDWSDIKDLDGRVFYTSGNPITLLEFNSNWDDIPKDTTCVQGVDEVNPNQSACWPLKIIETYFNDGSWVWVN
jgi:hypothetical protein